MSENLEQDNTPPDSESQDTPPPTASEAPDKDAKTWGMLCHLSALAGLIIPVGGSLLGPLVCWLVKRNDHPFIDDQGKESLNFQITVAIAIAICIPLMFVCIGIPLAVVIAVGSLVLAIIGAVKANNGEAYRYPWALRLIK